MKPLHLLINLTLTILLCSCNKDDTEKTLTKNDLLTTGNWQLTSVMSDDDGDSLYETDDFADFDPCFTDNVWTFQSNGILQLDEGSTKCDANDPQKNETTWQLTNNETTIVIHLDSWTILELTSTTLKWKEDYSDNRSSIVTLSKK